MTYLNVLGAVAVLEIALCSGLAQTRFHTSLSGSVDIVPHAQGMLFNDSSRADTFSLTGSAQRTMAWGVEEHTTSSDVFWNSDPRIASLLGSFSGGDSIGMWTLSLADLDSGQDGTQKQRGFAVAATPEPSTYVLIGLGALVLIHQVRRHSK